MSAIGGGSYAGLSDFDQIQQELLTQSGCTDIVLTKTSNGPIDAGNQGSFTISIKNNGSQASDPGTITDVLPADIDWSIDPAVAGCSLSGTGIGSDAKVLTCDVPALDPGGTEVLSVTVVADFPNAAGYCADLPNTAEFTYDGNTSGTPDKTASATLTVENCPTTGSISGSKYNDLNGNGERRQRRAEDVRLADRSSRSLQDNVVATTNTDGDGDYSFSNVTPGSYKVCEVQKIRLDCHCNQLTGLLHDHREPRRGLHRQLPGTSTSRRWRSPRPPTPHGIAITTGRLRRSSATATRPR